MPALIQHLRDDFSNAYVVRASRTPTFVRREHLENSRVFEKVLNDLLHQSKDDRQNIWWFGENCGERVFKDTKPLKLEVTVPIYDLWWCFFSSSVCALMTPTAAIECTIPSSSTAKRMSVVNHSDWIHHSSSSNSSFTMIILDAQRGPAPAEGFFLFLLLFLVLLLEDEVVSSSSSSPLS